MKTGEKHGESELSVLYIGQIKIIQAKKIVQVK